MSELSVHVRKYSQRFHRNGKRVQVGQEEVGVVDKDLVVQLRRVIEPEEERPRQETVFCFLYFVFVFLYWYFCVLSISKDRGSYFRTCGP